MGNSKLARHRFSWWIFYGFIFTLSCPCLDREVVFSSPVLLLEGDMEQQEPLGNWNGLSLSVSGSLRQNCIGDTSRPPRAIDTNM